MVELKFNTLALLTEQGFCAEISEAASQNNALNFQQRKRIRNSITFYLFPVGRMERGLVIGDSIIICFSAVQHFLQLRWQFVNVLFENGATE